MTTRPRVRDVMTFEVATLKRNDKLSIADDVMQLGRIRHLPVLDDDGFEVAGIVSQRDLLHGALARCIGYGEYARNKLYGQLLVKEVMTTDVVSVTPETSLEDAARLMVERKLGCLVVVDNDRLEGILTDSAFVKLQVEST